MVEATDIQVKHFDELSPRALHACLRLRAEVFVVDQRICVEADPDDHDLLAHHVMYTRDGKLIGTARLLVQNSGQVVKVGRVAVHRDDQGQGVGSEMMRSLKDWITQVPGRSGVMSAQAHLEKWYTSLGWVREGESYIEAEIEHVKMLYPA